MADPNDNQDWWMGVPMAAPRPRALPGISETGEFDPEQLKKPSAIPKLAAPQQEPTGLAPKLNTGAPPPALADFAPQAPKAASSPETPAGQPIVPKDMPRAEGTFHGTNPFQGMLKSFGDRKMALDMMMPTDVQNPNFLHELNQYRAARNAIKEEELNFKKDHPWGSVDKETGIENHPGFWGKVGHTLGTIGSVLAPGVAEEIPGSQPNLDKQLAQADAGIGKAETEEAGLQKAQAAVDTAGAKGTEAETNKNVKPREAAVKEGQLGVQDRGMTLKEDNPAAKFAEAALTHAPGTPEYDQALQVLKDSRAAAKPPNLSSVAGMSGGKQVFRDHNPQTGKYTDPVTGAEDPNFIPAPNQITQPQLPVVYADPNNQLRFQTIRQGGVVPNTAVNAPQFTKNEMGDQSAQGAIGAIGRYQNSFQNGRQLLTPADQEALKVLTAHAQQGMAHQIFQDAGTGLLDTLVGQPLTGYSQKLMEGTMRADMYDKLTPAGKQMYADYTHAIVANFVNMKQRLGGIGRNESQIQAEMANIPVPYAPADQARMMLDNTIRDAQSGLSPLSRGGGKQPAAPSGNRRVIDLTH